MAAWRDGVYGNPDPALLQQHCVGRSKQNMVQDEAFEDAG